MHNLEWMLPCTLQATTMWRTRMDGLCVSACSSRASAWVKILLACLTSLRQRSPVCSTRWHCRARSTFLLLRRSQARLCIPRLDIADSMPSACTCARPTCIYLCHYMSPQPLALISVIGKLCFYGRLHWAGISTPSWNADATQLRDCENKQNFGVAVLLPSTCTCTHIAL